MSRITNEPKIRNKLIAAIREQLEHRAFWLYLLCDEAGKRGLDWQDFGSAAVRRCGLSQGKGLVRKGRTKSLKGLKRTLFTKPAQWVFEMKVRKSTDEELFLDFHYCPLVKAWQKAGCTDEEIAVLCDIAMCGDHGIGACYDSVLELPKCIAKGDDICALRYKKKKQKTKNNN
ncbi:L-2-amino-thiazoline-4-carboxylic acid hydrolase [Ruminococcus gauvreauii]|uniref:L-2-amino-thiazoline-4-carboxylic acid hydrolase n=1 Tax=Ruminococcus gauvreauii TaxID=438033 RepID=A0ABY5VC69_9FIRM|nr:L-2-amino-thiazoline-4-carboxylic acid hydrolase [Ruminococcus gauvreauii]UWP58172.1 L-2-amino-thiazoline-4-carboxylic acid hydrolase [Ruminococcus gauvreauii]